MRRDHAGEPRTRRRHEHIVDASVEPEDAPECPTARASGRGELPGIPVMITNHWYGPIVQVGNQKRAFALQGDLAGVVLDLDHDVFITRVIAPPLWTGVAERVHL